jgi:hypothetical protein
MGFGSYDEEEQEDINHDEEDEGETEKIDRKDDSEVNTENDDVDEMMEHLKD